MPNNPSIGEDLRGDAPAIVEEGVLPYAVPTHLGTGEYAFGDIGIIDDGDLYNIGWLAAGSSVSFSIEGFQWRSFGIELSIAELSFYSSMGYKVASSGSVWLPHEVVFYPTQSGQYFLQVDGSIPSTGQYAISMNYTAYWPDPSPTPAPEPVNDEDSALIDDGLNDGLFNDSINSTDGAVISAQEAQVYRTYYGSLDREPDREGFNWWLSEIESGSKSITDMATGFFYSDEFQADADDNGNGKVSDSEFIYHMYRGVFDREPDTDGFDYWLGQLESDAKTEGEILQEMTQSDEYVEQTVEIVSQFEFI